MTAGSSPCGECQRRSWLVHCLGARLDLRRYDVERLSELIALPERELLAALGVADVAALQARHGAPDLEAPTSLPGPYAGVPVHAICRHDPRYPRAKGASGCADDGWAPPAILNVAGDIGVLSRLDDAPAVAIAGTRRATDYGLELANRLGREIAGSGLTVLGAFADGISGAAHAGACDHATGTLTVLAGGAGHAHPAGKRLLYADVLKRGCAISELPPGARPRRWSYAARNRIVAGLASLVVVVEAEDRPSDLMLPRFAQRLGRTVVAVPGRVTSVASAGTHALLVDGAPLVRDAQDVLDALSGVGAKRVAESPAIAGRDRTDPFNARVLELVSRGADTADRLVAQGVSLPQALGALTELELSGQLTRGDGGRYLTSRRCARRSHPGVRGAGSRGEARAPAASVTPPQNSANPSR
jgi:DNA processing protein